MVIIPVGVVGKHLTNPPGQHSQLKMEHTCIVETVQTPIHLDKQLELSRPNGISYTGHWIKLELVNAIKLQKAFINAYNLDAGGDDRRPKKGVFLGSNGTTGIWTHLDGDLGWGRLLANQYGATINFSNISTRYKYILLLVEEKTSYHPHQLAMWIEIFNIEFYGTEEGDASTDRRGRPF